MNSESPLSTRRLTISNSLLSKIPFASKVALYALDTICGLGLLATNCGRVLENHGFTRIQNSSRSLEVRSAKVFRIDCEYGKLAQRMGIGEMLLAKKAATQHNGFPSIVHCLWVVTHGVMITGDVAHRLCIFGMVFS